MEKLKKDAKVEWQWAGSVISGTVEEVFTESVTKEIKGKKITRHGTPEKPAYLVRSQAGNLALKLATELRGASPAKQKFDIKLFKER